MPESTEIKKERSFIVHTVGGEKLPIRAYSYVVNERENRVYFLDADNEIKEDWVVLVSGVAAIEEPSETAGTPGTGNLRIR